MDRGTLVKLLQCSRLIYEHLRINRPLVLGLFDSLVVDSSTHIPERVSFTEIKLYQEDLHFLDNRLSALSPVYPIWIHKLKRRQDWSLISPSIADTVLSLSDESITIFHLIHVFTKLYSLIGQEVKIPFGQEVNNLYQDHPCLLQIISKHRYLSHDSVIPHSMARYPAGTAYYHRLDCEDDLSNLLLFMSGGVVISSETKSKNLGIDDCVNSAKSPYLRCAINPLGPCENCSHYEITVQA